MRIGQYVWDIEPEEMKTEEIEALIEGLQFELEERALERIENEFERAFQTAYREGYKVFHDGAEIDLFDLYIAVDAPQ